MRFKIGQQIVCIHQGAWIGTGGFPARQPMPKFNEIVTVSGAGTNRWGYGIELAEYPLPLGCYFYEKWFEPIITDKELVEELSTIPEFQTQ